MKERKLAKELILTDTVGTVLKYFEEDRTKIGKVFKGRRLTPRKYVMDFIYSFLLLFLHIITRSNCIDVFYRNII